jgi:hypothetical protein
LLALATGKAAGRDAAAIRAPPGSSRSWYWRSRSPDDEAAKRNGGQARLYRRE